MNPYRLSDNDKHKPAPIGIRPAIWKNLARIILLSPFVLFAVYVLSFVGYGYHESWKVDSFCDTVGGSDTPESIAARADARGLPHWGGQDSDDIWILNKETPMFRFACVVKFKGGNVFGKEVIDAD